MRPSLTYLPVLIFGLLLAFFFYRLVLIERGHAPNMIPSVLINKPAPHFDLPALQAGRPRVTSEDMDGNVILINFFSSWCVPCRAEHTYLSDITKEGIVLIGINYKDKPEDALAWLGKLGNPFTAIGSDLDGRIGIDYGVYGVPETYVIDRKGIIRFKQTGPLDEDIIQNQILPLAKELNK